MKAQKPVLALFVSVVMACLVGLAAWFRWDVEVVETVRSGSREFVVELRGKERIYAGLPHMAGWYLSNGKTKLEIVSGPQRWAFVADEELDLVGVHEIEDGLFLLFVAQYRPERGFLAFQGSEETSFTSLPLTQVPPKAAFANFGSRGMTARGFFDVAEVGTMPPNGFYDSATAWLWSQMATGKPVLGNQLAAEAVRDHWKKWAPIIAEEIRASKH